MVVFHILYFVVLVVSFRGAKHIVLTTIALQYVLICGIVSFISSFFLKSFLVILITLSRPSSESTYQVSLNTMLKL